jgi:uncharacterized membrane protein YoaK (UPF0700 family)
MKIQKPFLLLLFACALLSALTLPVTASDDTITLTFQDLGIIQEQTIRIYNGSGHLIETVNTSSSVELLTNNTGFYTLQIQPTATNVTGLTILDQIQTLLTSYWWLVLFVLLILVFVFGGRK